MSVDLAIEWSLADQRVLPVNGSTKRPLIKAWQENCTYDQVQIHDWWRTYPDARVGIATGEPGFDVLDFDVAEGKPGLEQMQILLDAGIFEVGTFKMVATPSGGRHLYFKGTAQHNKQNDSSVWGVDLRATGGMVLAPGNPGYRWLSGQHLTMEELKPIDWAAVAACPGLIQAPPKPGRPVLAPPARSLPATPKPAIRTGKLVAPMQFDNAPGEESPLDWFCRNTDLGAMLAADGWQYVYTDQERDYYTRPGKATKDGVSGNVWVNPDGRQTLINFSSSVDLPTDRGMSAAQYLAYRDFGGEIRTAASHIRRSLMPQRQTTPPAAPPVTPPALAGTDAPPSAPVVSVGTPGAELVVSGQAGMPEPVTRFWDSHAELREVWWKAQMGGVSPWAVLGNILAGVAARVGPHVVLPAIGGVGKAASLNILVAVSGNSGTGKGLSGSVGREFLGHPYPPQRKPGTGQGIAAMFTEQTKEGPVQSNDTVVLNVSEITQLGAHMGQQGATITSTLLEVYMGEELGEHYANKELRRPVKDGHYRLALVAGVQPGNSHIIFDHAESGLPQRFIWMPAYWDAAVLPEGELRPPAPGSETRRWSSWPAILPGTLDESPDPYGGDWQPSDAAKPPGKKEKEPEAIPAPVKDPWLVQYAPLVRREIERDRLRRLNAMKRRAAAGEDDPGDPDSHILLTRAKVATLLAVWLDNTTYVSDEMWEKSRWVIWVSNDTRISAQKRLQQKAADKTAGRAAQRVTETAMVEELTERKHNALTLKIMDRIVTICRDAHVVYKLISQGIAGRDKKAMREADILLQDLLDELVSTGALERKEPEGAERGVRYRARR